MDTNRMKFIKFGLLTFLFVVVVPFTLYADVKPFYRGQEVWDILRGRGVVIETKIGYYPITVRFEDRKVWSYFFNGKEYNNEPQRLFPIENKSIRYEVHKLFPLPCCNCPCSRIIDMPQ